MLKTHTVDETKTVDGVIEINEALNVVMSTG
jgi:hypothetical protein